MVSNIHLRHVFVKPIYQKKISMSFWIQRSAAYIDLPKQRTDLCVIPRLCMHAQSCPVFVTPWTVTHQAPLSMESPGKNTGVNCHFLLQGIFPTQGLNLRLLHWQVDSVTTDPLGKPPLHSNFNLIQKSWSRNCFIRSIIWLTFAKSYIQFYLKKSSLRCEGTK